jgi:hypothetical protein
VINVRRFMNEELRRIMDNLVHRYSFQVGYLTTLSVSRLWNVSDVMINDCGTVGGMRLERGEGSIRRKTA